MKREKERKSPELPIQGEERKKEKERKRRIDSREVNLKGK